ncbi:alkaline phosphatase PhoX [Aerosakkonema sp. BLCC-F183]|uniref:alkaline phosphatase PhoX n=1 Tax=Aerosakkonema sp. BLCC-F183 TaxID=3342834 RepID=UPI0035B7CE55
MAATPYVNNVTGNPGYEFIPVLTVGDEVPMIEGTVGNFRVAAGKTFAMTGIPDGMGVFETKDYNYLFLNHEIASLDSKGNPLFSEISSTVSGKIQGARVSLFVFDKNWNIIGGKNLIEKAVDTTGQYVLNTSTGTYANATTGQNLSFTRFCSAYLAQYGFVDANGQEVPIYFAPEETTNNTTTGESSSRGWAISPDGVALAIDGLGRYAKENVVAASQYRATNSDKTVLFSTEDFTDGELYMFVGQQTPQDPNGFKDGQLYALKVDGLDAEIMAEGVKLGATWTPIPKDVTLDPTGTVLHNWVNTSGRTTNFRRLEDFAEDPNNPGTFYFVTTGTTDKAAGGKANTPAEAENPYGKLYRFSLNPNDPAGKISNFELVMTGSLDTGVSYDNIVVTTNGKVMICEDETSFGGDAMSARARDAGIWSYDIATDKVTLVAELNESAAGSQFNNTSKAGEWETSGIIEIGSGRNNYMFDVQAHTIADRSTMKGNYVEGGQLIRAVWMGPDVLFAKGNQEINGNKGNDSISGAGSSGNNILRGGQGDDYLTGGTKDIIYGDNGNDIIVAGASNIVNGNKGKDNITGAANCIMRGGQDDDILFGGTNSTLYGDLGNDVLFAGNGNNILFGGDGIDEFRIANTTLPVAVNIIADFKAGTDAISLSSVPGATSFGSLTLSQNGADVLISIAGKDVALIQGIQVSAISSSNFLFR